MRACGWDYLDGITALIRSPKYPHIPRKGMGVQQEGSCLQAGKHNAHAGTLCQTSSLHHHEKMHVCCLSHTVCGILSWQPRLTNTNGHTHPLPRFVSSILLTRLRITSSETVHQAWSTVRWAATISRLLTEKHVFIYFYLFLCLIMVTLESKHPLYFHPMI